MVIKLSSLCPLFFLIFGSLQASASQCEYSKIIDGQFNADEFKSLDLKVLAGSLEVTGDPKFKKIRYHGEVCTDEKEYLSQIRMDEQKNGSELALTLLIPQRHHDDFDPEYAYVDMEIEVPANLMMKITDSSGEIETYNASITHFDDSSGGIRVTNNRVGLDIRDSSGSIIIKGAKGDVKIKDSSGNIVVRNVTGSLHIPSDSSGDIEVMTVSADVTIDNDSSGNIEIVDVGSNVTIGSDGSGNIDIEKVDGYVRIRNDGSGSITISEVKKEVKIGHDGSGRLSVADIGGDFVVDGKGSGGIRNRNVSGKVDIPR